MADTIREKILKNIKTTLEGIAVANGYVNTVQNVQRYQLHGNSLATVPCITIIDADENKKDLPGLIKECELHTVINIYLTHDTIADPVSTDELINSWIGDIEKALMVDYTRGGYAEMTKIEGNMLFELDEGVTYAGIMIEMTILYKHKADDPTSQ